MWLIHIICYCLPFLFVFFLLPFLCILPSLLPLLLSLTFQNMDPLRFQGGDRRMRPNLDVVCFVLMFAVFLVKDACLLWSPYGIGQTIIFSFCCFFLSSSSIYGIGVLKDSSGSYVYRDDMKTELLNDYFTSVFTSDNNNLPYTNRRCSTEIGDIVFTHVLLNGNLES